MYALSNKHVQSWHKPSTAFVPNSIAVQCPECGNVTSFANLTWHAAAFNTRIASQECPSCGKRSQFYLISHTGKAGTLDKGEELYIAKHPPGRVPLPEILASGEISEPIQRAYLSAVNVFNSGEWAATAVLTRRLLEGLTKSLLPETTKLSLAKQVEKLSEVKDLTVPITTIADAIRKGGNLGAHFDLEAEPDQHIAALMVELVEELMQYFYVLPGRIQSLHEQIEKLGPSHEA